MIIRPASLFTPKRIRREAILLTCVLILWVVSITAVASAVIGYIVASRN